MSTHATLAADAARRQINELVAERDSLQREVDRLRESQQPMIPVARLRDWAKRQERIWAPIKTEEAAGYRAALEDVTAQVLARETLSKPSPTTKATE
jgi:hypothetical protein